MKYRYSFILAILLLCAEHAVADSISAGQPRIFDAMPNVTVHQDETIVTLLDRKSNRGEHQLTEISGWRVQVFSSNKAQSAKSDAIALEKRLLSQYGGAVYVQYATPWWKVRVGDFRTRQEALEFKDELIKLFPELVSDAYVVPDIIQVVL